MAATIIKSYNSDAQAIVNSDGQLHTQAEISGPVTVNITPLGTTVLVYNESVVPIGVETTVTTYTVLGATAALSNIGASGENIGEIRVYKNGVIIDKQYLYYTSFNLTFAFPAIPLISGDIIAVKALNNGQDICNFNAKIQLTEVV